MFSDQTTCGCGEKARYMTHTGWACNKRLRCPTYAELQAMVVELRTKLLTLPGWREVPVPPQAICILWNGTMLSSPCAYDHEYDRARFIEAFWATHYFPIPPAPGHPASEVAKES